MTWCEFESAGQDDRGRCVYSCTRCGAPLHARCGANVLRACTEGNAREVEPHPLEETTSGPGTELEKLLATLGFRASASCACKKLRDDMDKWGSAGCRERIEEILDRLERNAKLLKVRLFSRKAARVTVKIAIAKAKRKGL